MHRLLKRTLNSRRASMDDESDERQIKIYIFLPHEAFGCFSLRLGIWVELVVLLKLLHTFTFVGGAKRKDFCQGPNF